MNESASWIVSKFYNAPDGTANRQRRESDLDGSNPWDYYYWAYNYGESPFTPPVNEVWSNCLNGCDWN